MKSLKVLVVHGFQVLCFCGGTAAQEKFFKNEISETVVSDMTGPVTLKSALMRQVPTKLHEIE